MPMNNKSTENKVSGQEVALANLSAAQVKEMGLMTSGTYGLTGSISLRSAYLLQSLVSRFQERRDLVGSNVYSLTWTHWDEQVLPSTFRLVASVPRTKGTEPIGSRKTLPTPTGTSNHGKNHVVGRLDEWGGSSNPFRGTPLGRVRCVAFELWMMGYPMEWLQQMPHVTRSALKSHPLLLKHTMRHENE